MKPLAIGTAGWALRSEWRELFPEPGTHLQRYARKLNAVEINSSFYRDHQPKTYARWTQETPPGFRFAVKLAKRFTHVQALAFEDGDLRACLEGYNQLGEKFGALLVQLPPKLAYHREAATRFFERVREHVSAPVVLEPRHATWAEASVFEALAPFGVSPVLADPGLDLRRFLPAAGNKCVYLRLHGFPEIYKSDYDNEFLEFTAHELQQYAEGAFQQNAERGLDPWCIFDNTTYGYATINALTLTDLVQDSAPDAEEEPQARNPRGARRSGDIQQSL